MSQNELRFPDDAPDREIGEALRPLLSPPADPTHYWTALESRVMRTLAEERNSPWAVLAGWSRPAAVAAVLLLAAATVTLTQLRHDEEAIAYGAMSEERYTAEPATEASARADATVHMLLEH
jgi:hypothetical protein